ncbi:HYC_CC_PP family protein [Flectobacillus major]|uniref:HYC_CC_PP family protein n=1 Tax=Flectobacillus major TaxID=103 RepID=UPI0011843144|nr:hypothetical protein [Flectobacillus major]
MKSFITRIFCFIMALQVLFSSTGFAMNEHYCKIKGEKVWSFTKKNACCSTKEKQQFNNQKPSFKKTKCCGDKVVYNKISAESTHANSGENLAKNTPLDWECFVPAIVSLRNELLPIECASVIFYHSPAPPLTGRQVLLFIQSFLI